jgi:hypothetical protein
MCMHVGWWVVVAVQGGLHEVGAVQSLATEIRYKSFLSVLPSD